MNKKNEFFYELLFKCLVNWLIYQKRSTAGRNRLFSYIVSSLFVFYHFLSLPSLSIDLSSSQYHILLFTINLPYLTFTLFRISLSFSATLLINHCILCCFHVKSSSIISLFPFRFLFFPKTSILTSNSHSLLNFSFLLISLTSPIYYYTIIYYYYYLLIVLFAPKLS